MKGFRKKKDIEERVHRKDGQYKVGIKFVRSQDKTLPKWVGDRLDNQENFCHFGVYSISSSWSSFY